MKRDLIRSAFGSVLPFQVRAAYLEIYDLYSDKPRVQRIVFAVSQVSYGYKKLAFASINLYASIAELVLVNFCLFAATSLQVQPAFLFADATVLGTLILRGIWSHRIFASKSEMPPLSKYYLDSAMDAIVAGVMLLFAQCVATWFSSSAALPGGVLGPFSAICLPLIAVFQMTLRPMPDPQTPGSWRGLTALQIYRNTRRLNIIWAVLYCGTILMNTSDIPNYYPDRLRGFVPVALLTVLVLSQLNGLVRRIKMQVLLKNPDEAELRRLQANLPQGLNRGEPFYWLMRTLEVLVFAVLSVSQGEVMWRWLSGLGGHLGRLMILTNTVSFIMIVIGWKHIKHANIAAAKAMQVEIWALQGATVSV